MDFERYQREQEEADVDNYYDSVARTKPVQVSQVKKMSPVSILEKYLLLWPPRDVRCEMSYLADHEFNFTDSQFMEDIVDGMILKVINRNPRDNAITLGLYLQSNLAEFERYNAVVDQHNDDWVKQGRPEDVFNPLTGDISEITEQIVSSADTENPYEKRPRMIQTKGPLTKARPNIKRNLYAQIEFRLKVSDDRFFLSFVAKDYNSQIIYYNVLCKNDIAYLTRRAIQELFGNPFVYGDIGALLDGIAFLIQGKKLQICVKENIKPAWMMGSLKTSNPKLAVSQATSVWYKILGWIFGGVIPVAIFWQGVLVRTYYALRGFADTMHGDHSWFLGVIGSCVLIVISFLIAKFCFRMSNVFKLNSNLL
jgi:hypothetical protein